MHLSIASIVTMVLSSISVTVAINLKRGLAFADGTFPIDINQANKSGSAISWVYDWGSSPPSYLASSGIPYIPMQWGAGGIETFASEVLGQGANIILGFNEPDLSSQSDISPSDAASFWLKYIRPLATHGIKLGAPAVTNQDSGMPWLALFLADCTNCTFDFIPLHWYGDDLGLFYDYVWSFHGEFPNWPLWITEFADTSTNDADVSDFLINSIDYLDTLDWIEGNAWFALFRNSTLSPTHYNLLDVNGNLDSLGTAYVLL